MIDGDRSFASGFLAETARIAEELPHRTIDRMAEALAEVRARGGRLFVIGIGGGAGHASHAVNDFRKPGRPIRHSMGASSTPPSTSPTRPPARASSTR
jgi:hypothetical protein